MRFPMKGMSVNGNVPEKSWDEELVMCGVYLRVAEFANCVVNHIISRGEVV